MLQTEPNHNLRVPPNDTTAPVTPKTVLRLRGTTNHKLLNLISYCKLLNLTHRQRCFFVLDFRSDRDQPPNHSTKTRKLLHRLFLMKIGLKILKFTEKKFTQNHSLLVFHHVQSNTMPIFYGTERSRPLKEVKCRRCTYLIGSGCQDNPSQARTPLLEKFAKAHKVLNLRRRETNQQHRFR